MNRKQTRWILTTIILAATWTQSLAQTVVQGIVTDKNSKQPLPYVSVVFKGGRGIVTDSIGRYTLRSPGKIATIQFSYIGYKTILKSIRVGSTQTIDTEMEMDSKTVSDVTVTGHKRAPYRNKDNPAVELIRRVIENKAINRIEHYDYVQYDQYEKLQISLSKVSDNLPHSRFLRKYQFMFDNRDTIKLKGKALLPVYLEEALSKKYFRKKPEKTKTLITGEKKVNYGDYIDESGVSSYLNRLYMNVDIYDNNIPLFTYEVLSPIASLGPTFYMYHIRDTITDANGTKLVKLFFTPRNTNDLLFRGKMYITLDGNYAVQKIHMFLSKNTNLNWVRELHINLDFEQGEDSRYHLSKSHIMADISIAKNSTKSFFGERTVSVKNFRINMPLPDSIYAGLATEQLNNALSHSDTFWQSNRHDTLTKAESKIYSNVDSLEKMPSFRRTMATAMFLFSGYAAVGRGFEIGPVPTFYSFNPVEGFRLRFGGRTTPQFHKRLYFETYGAYGFRDNLWKYFLSASYSLNNKSIYTFPLQYLRVSYQRDTKIPGQQLQFVSEDNFLLSFKRGVNDKWLYNRNFKIEYVHELENRLSYTLGFKNWHQEPAGSILYSHRRPNGTTGIITKLVTSELSAELRWAPNEQFYQGKSYRKPIINKYPIITLRFVAGIKGLMDGEYNYQKLTLQFKKRAYMSQLGYSDVLAETGYIFGQLPYPLMKVHHANQTFAYQLNSYNMMNFQEFVSDQYTSLHVEHHFNGFFFNRVPLLKKLNLRELVSVKMIFGGVRDENNPFLNSSMIQYPKRNGISTTYSLNNTPYIEGSIGIANIFKLLRIDLAKRFSYLSNPNVSSQGIRARIELDF